MLSLSNKHNQYTMTVFTKNLIHPEVFSALYVGRTSLLTGRCFASGLRGNKENITFLNNSLTTLCQNYILKVAIYPLKSTNIPGKTFYHLSGKISSAGMYQLNTNTNHRFRNYLCKLIFRLGVRCLYFKPAKLINDLVNVSLGSHGKHLQINKPNTTGQFIILYLCFHSVHAEWWQQQVNQMGTLQLPKHHNLRIFH